MRVGEGLGITPDEVRYLEPLSKQERTAEDRERLANPDNNLPRDVEGLIMTYYVSNKRVVVSRSQGTPSLESM